MTWLSGLSTGWPVNQKVASLIPIQGTCLGRRPGPRLGACERQPIDVSLPLSLKINKVLKTNKQKISILSVFGQVYNSVRVHSGRSCFVPSLPEAVSSPVKWGSNSVHCSLRFLCRSRKTVCVGILNACPSPNFPLWVSMFSTQNVEGFISIR